MSNRYPNRNVVAARPSGSPASVPTRPRPVPANDNRPPIKPPAPANDNFPRNVPKPKNLGTRWIGKALGRLIPGIGIVLTAWELYDLWKQMNDQFMLPGRPMSISGYRRRDELECTVNGPWDSYMNFASVTGLCGGGFNGSASLPAAISQPFTQAQVYEWWKFINPTQPVRQYSRRHRWDRLATPGPNPGFIIPPSPVIIPELPPFIPYISPGMPRPGQEIWPFQPPVHLPRPGWTPGAVPGTWSDGRPHGSSRGDYSEKKFPAPNGRPLPRPAPKGTRERKVRMKISAVRRLMGWLVSNYSEAMDLVEALWDALPEKFRTKDANQKQKLLDLYNHIDDIDVVEGLTNWLQNDREDKIWGHGFQKINEVFEAYGIELPSGRL